jgi:hypothetical protein
MISRRFDTRHHDTDFPKPDDIQRQPVEKVRRCLNTTARKTSHCQHQPAQTHQRAASVIGPSRRRPIALSMDRSRFTGRSRSSELLCKGVDVLVGLAVRTGGVKKLVHRYVWLLEPQRPWTIALALNGLTPRQTFNQFRQVVGVLLF